MQDKSFLQAMQDLQDRISGNIQESLHYMLLHRTTVTNATLEIQDETVRAVVTNELITGQIIALLALMRDLHILNATQYDEFATYLQRSLASHYGDVTMWSDPSMTNSTELG